jgi:hypothetical protein
MIVVVLFAVAIMAAVRHPEKSPFWFLLSGAAIAIGSYIGAAETKLSMLGVMAGRRYAFLPRYCSRWSS